MNANQAGAQPTAQYPKDAKSVWTRLDGKRQSMLRRLEKLAGYTLPHLMLPDGWDANQDGMAHDYQSFGAQAVNHLATKLMLAMFAPTRPFMRLDASAALKRQVQAAGIKDEDLQNLLSQGERAAVKELDSMAARPKLFDLFKNLIVLGNVMLLLPEDAKEDEPRVIGLRRFVVKRSLDGMLHTAVIREQVQKDELSEEAQALLPKKEGHSMVEYFIMVCRKSKTSYEVTHSVDDMVIAGKTKTYEYENLPYRVVSWNLADYADYGTGLAEEYMGALAALSTISASTIKASVLAGEFRWLANPAGMTRPEDFNDSENGSCLAGVEGDLSLVQAAAEVAQAIGVNRQLAQDYTNVLGRGFLMAGAVTRDAERVTAEEIRMIANELETGLGGAYSRLAVDVQLPLARYLLRRIDLQIGGEDIKPTIVTGLDALSRNGDLEALKAYISDVASITSLPPEVMRWLPMDTILRDLATGRGLDGQKYSNTKPAADAQQGQEDQRQVAVDNATAAGAAQAKAAAEGAQ
jgi:Bacteriophage head to tail connecting protein